MPAPLSSIPPKDADRIIGDMSAGDPWPGIFFLNCGLERRVNVLSQQIRGISLVSALLASGRLKRNHRVAVIGGGVAGISAACRAVHGGCDVTVLEAGPEALHRLKDSTRYLHPRLYEWPREHFGRQHSDLSILNWFADTAEKITACLSRQWALWLRLYAPDNKKATGHLHWQPNVLCQELFIQDNRPHLCWRQKDSGSILNNSFDCVILAVGFGGEPDSLDISERGVGQDGLSYWQRGVHKIPGTRKDWTLAVSGIGDSALRDVLNDLLQHDLLELTGNKTQLDTLTRALETVRDAAWALLDLERGYVHQAKSPEARAANREICRNVEALFRSLPPPEGVSLALPDGVDSVQVLMQGRSDASHLAPVSFPLNRYLLSSLEKAGQVRVDYVQDESAGKKPAADRCVKAECKRYRLLYPPSCWPSVGKHPLVDRAYYRYGAERVLKVAFPDIFDTLSKSKDPRLDTGEQLYRPVSQGGSGAPKRIFYSDLHDSVIQRELEAKFDSSGISDLFVPLFAGRLRLELLMRDSIILTDAQLLDGRFFIKHWQGNDGIPALSLEEFCRLTKTGRILVKFRPSGTDKSASTSAVWNALEPMLLAVKDETVTSKRFLLSGLGTHDNVDLRKRIQNTDSHPDRMGSSQQNVSEYMRRLAIAAQPSRPLRDAVEAQVSHWERCSEAGFDCQPWNGDFYLAGGFEDPAGFLLGLESAKGEEFALRAFAEAQRSRIDDEWWAMRQDRNPLIARDAVKIYEWYNRAYHRTIARQHGATVIETTYVQRFPKYMHQHMQRWRHHPPNVNGPALRPEHLLALAMLEEEEFLNLLDFRRRFTHPGDMVAVLEDLPFWKRSAGQFSAQCASLPSALNHDVEPEFRLLCGTVHTAWQPLDEFRIFDSISPAGVQVNCLGGLDQAESRACSLVEFLEP